MRMKDHDRLRLGSALPHRKVGFLELDLIELNFKRGGEMIKIKRDKDGNHFVDGKSYNNTLMRDASLYKKKTLTYGICMEEPFSVETLEGTMEGKAGDWLMIGVRGEMYPCDAEIFEQSYEPIQGG